MQVCNLDTQQIFAPTMLGTGTLEMCIKHMKINKLNEVNQNKREGILSCLDCCEETTPESLCVVFAALIQRYQFLVKATFPNRGVRTHFICVLRY